jgi:hypothetical protein
VLAQIQESARLCKVLEEHLSEAAECLGKFKNNKSDIGDIDEAHLTSCIRPLCGRDAKLHALGMEGFVERIAMELKDRSESLFALAFAESETIDLSRPLALDATNPLGHGQATVANALAAGASRSPRIV